ncbi:endonuclease V isoform X1 [Leptonychotes weddellii]|uniref:Endonuclease V isoform X1 n=1 Tax=Leptonychotes weddellii TaxID=9713 RepID=A0A7F8Q565_LEPWE|nr:endonuclease V isoform X1 [Leptonychotes weddellii]
MAREAVAWPPEETLSLWKREQARLKALVVDRDTEAWQRDAAFSGLQRVGGVDVSFVKGDSVSACASLVVLSYPELEVVYEDCCMVSLTAPYVSGFLAFREVPFLVDAVRRLQEKEPRLVPQVLLVDGNGVLHHRGGRRHLPPQPDNCEIGAEGCVPGQAGSPSPVFPVLSPPTGLCLPGKIRRVLVCSLSTPSLDYLAHCPTSPASLSAPAGFGVACHLGVLTDLPCVGVAKKLLQVDGLENDAQHKEKIRLLRAGGDSFPLIGGSGTVLGMVLKSHKHSSKPLYVSVGHKISLEAAVRLTRGCCRFRIPEPVRQADIRSRDYIRRTLGVPGPPAPGQERSQKVQRPKVCPQEGSEEPEGEGRPPEAHS